MLGRVHCAEDLLFCCVTKGQMEVPGIILLVGASNLREDASAMQTTRVAAVSMNGFLGESERVLAAIDGWCERAFAAKADLAVFPELVVHGHCTPNTWELAEPVPDGPSVRRLCNLARRHRITLSVGLSEKERDI